MLGAQNLKKQFKIPGMFYVPNPSAEQQFNAIDMKGYMLFLPNSFQRNAAKESEFEDKQHGKNKITFLVREQTPIDFLDKMQDKEKDLRILCDSAADDFLRNQDIANPNDPPSFESERFLIHSKPYVRKSNLTNDRSVIVCWESHLRFSGCDLYITIMRRSYIPPVMDMY